MISAVAARKAAIAKAQAEAQTNHSSNDDNDVAMAEVPEAGPSAPSSSKRKSAPTSEAEQQRTPSSSRTKKKPRMRKQKHEDESEGESEEQVGGASRKEKRKDRKKDNVKKKRNLKSLSKTPRYFATPQNDEFEQEDTIALSSASESDSESLVVRLEDAEEEEEGDDAVLSSEGLSDENDFMRLDGGITLSTLFPRTEKPDRRQTTTPLSTFKPIVGENVFSLSGDELLEFGLRNLPPSTILLLPPHDTLCLLGTCTITVLHGSISIFGATLHASSEAHPVFVPKSSPLPVIRSAFIPTKSSPYSLLPRLKMPTHIEIDEDTQRHGAVLLFSELRTGVEGLGRICRPFLNVFEPSKWQQQQNESSVMGIRGLSIVYDELSDTHPFVLAPSWSTALDRAISSNLPLMKDGADEETGNVFLLKGPKNTGKSTFAKMLVNRLLEVYTNVAYLDLDPGQPEFTPPGLISLSLISKPVFGPPWSHLAMHSSSLWADERMRSTGPPDGTPVIVRSVYLGSTTPKDEVELWIDGARALWEGYRELRSRHGDAMDFEVDDEDENGGEDSQGEGEAEENLDDRRVRRKMRSRSTTSVPLVINTMGWTNGLGADLTRKIEEEFGLSDIFAFSSHSHQHEEEGGDRRHRHRHHQHHHGFGAFENQQHSNGFDDYNFNNEGTSHDVRLYDLLPAAQTQPEGMEGGLGAVGKGRWTSASDQRTMSLLSYFHSVLPPPSTPSSSPSKPSSSTNRHGWDTRKPLLAMRPYNLSLREAGIKKVVLCGAGSEDVVPEELGRVLCGAIVGLVAVDDDDGGSDDDNGDGGEGHESLDPLPLRPKWGQGTLPYVQGRSPPSPYTSTCIGLGIVRGVHPQHIQGSAPSLDERRDSQEGEEGENKIDLQILTPVPPSLLQKTRVLVKGDMELPVWGWLDFRSFDSTVVQGAAEIVDGDGVSARGKGEGIVEMDPINTPFLQWGKLGGGRQKGGEKRRVRRNVLRRGLM